MHRLAACRRSRTVRAPSPVFKGLVHKIGIGRHEAVLGRERLLCPKRGASADLMFAAKVNFFVPCRAGSLIPNGRSRPRTWLPSARLTRTNRS